MTKQRGFEGTDYGRGRVHVAELHITHRPIIIIMQ